MNDFDRAVHMTVLFFTTDTFLFIDHHRARCLISRYSPGRTNFGAVGIFAMITNNGKVVEVFIDVLNIQRRQVRIKSVKEPGGAFQLTD